MASPLAIPLKLDAFVLNPDTCDGTDRDQAKIAPLQQPNYSYLRMKDFMTRNDVLQPLDLHAAAPHQANSRVTNLATGQLRQSRLGVYLHWMIPRPYRSGISSTKSPDATAADDTDPQMPVFPECPNRWLVIRKLAGPTDPTDVLQPVRAWIVYSDWMRTIDELDDTDERPLDLQVDVSPYLSTGSTVKDHQPSIDQQAEVFIGGRTNATKKEMVSPSKSVSLGVLNSSNQLFPDYQPHNGNVFSMLDDFSYNGAEGPTQVAHAIADYYVLGWHENPADDLLVLKSGNRRDRLNILSMNLKNETDPAIQSWLEETTGARVLCHGAMYGVRWNSTWNKSHDKPTILADQAAKALADRVPVSLGTTPMDALLAYVANHSGDTEHLLSQLGALLRAQSESIEDRRAGNDEVQNYNFEKTAGGARYILQADTKNPAQPPPDHAARVLEELNDSQTLYDATSRQLRRAQWSIFSIWWQYVTDLDRAEKQEAYKREVNEAITEYGRLNGLFITQRGAVDAAKKKIDAMQLEVKEAIAPDFSQPRDPTLFVGEVQAGWPIDYLAALQVRLAPQIAGTARVEPINAAYGLECLPEELQAMGTQLVQEFEHYADAKSSHRAVVKSPETFPPLYHDGRDRWNNTQPWFPLFLEWEAEYFHVPYDQWDMEDISTHPAKDKKFSYTVKQDDGPLWEKDNNDKRTVSGRILLLPQPVFSLHAQVERLFSTVPAEVLNPILDSDQRAQLLKDIQKLPFISAPLGGFTDHLVTVVDGSHVKPTVRYPGKLPEPLTEAASESHLVGLDIDALRKIGVENDLTPYGSLVRIGDLQHPAFKPVTHGQFRLIKLNIIDKFGQAVAAIDPTRRVEGPPPLYPHIGEYYRPQAYQNTKIPNVVIQPEEPEKCPFIQIPPNINQPARLHMNWVQLEEYNKTYEWRPITEWENPIWGWVVVNYVNYGVQFFLRDGTFYREVRVASPNNPNPGAVASDKWLPFQPPKEDPKRQLDQLIKKFTDDQNYLLGFMEMINTAVENARSVPGAYSQCVNSLIGRPLALVNAGFSLELAENARTNQSTVGNQQGMLPPISLLPDYRIPQYDFAIKLGDSVRPHDGLVGFFKAKDKPQPTDELDLTDVYTPFPNDTKQIHPIDSQGGGFLRLKPFWLNPGDYTDKSLGNPSETYIRDRNRHLTVCGLLVDPFTPVNAYSSILPVEPLALSPWTWESALLKMTAFFHFGPLVIEDDVPELNPKKVLTANYNLENDTVKEKIKLPALAAAEWSWLQPYINTETEVTEQEETEAEGKEVYMALSLGKIDPVPQFSPGPLTAVEGYLQMKRPITGPDSK